MWLIGTLLAEQESEKTLLTEHWIMVWDRVFLSDVLYQ